MKIILLADVPNLGKKNDIVEVNDGYAKNFLIKNKKAVQYTENSLSKLNQELDHQDQVWQEKVYQATLLKEKLEAMSLTFYLNANHGHAFGKVSIKHLVDEINKHEKLVNKFMFEEKEWGLGPHTIKVNVLKGVVALIKINVLEK